MEHAGRAVPRLCALLDLQAQQFQALGVGFFPFLARVAVVLNVARQVTGHRLNGTLVHLFGQIDVKVVLSFNLGQLDGKPRALDGHRFGINDLNFNALLVLCQCVDALRLLEECFVDVRCHVDP